MSNIGRNDPCPSGAGVKFKKCLRQHSGLSLKSSAGAIWWVCDRWQVDEPEFDDVMKTWRDLDDPDPDKVERFLERMFGEPVDSIDWARMLEGFHTKHYRDLPGLYRRMNTSISGLPGREMGRFLGSAVEIARVGQPEMYEELLAAILELDPDDTQMESLESIVSWADEQERAEDCDRLRKRFLQFPQFLLEEEDEEEKEEPEMGRENGLPKFPPEIERQLDLAWDEFKAIKSPTADDAEALLECLLELPHEATSWVDVFDVAREMKHPEIFKVFTRIVTTVSQSSNDDLSYICWGAMEVAKERKETERFPEIARSFQGLDSESIDSEALSHAQDHLLADGFIGENLDLMEHFFPALRDNEGLMPWVVPHVATEIVTLRIGNLVMSDGLSGAAPEPILAGLLKGLENEVNAEFYGKLVRRLTSEDDQSISKQYFQLSPDGKEAGMIAILGAFVDAARMAWKSRHVHPGRILIGLNMIHQAASNWIVSCKQEKRKFLRNLLDYLQPQNIERQVARECQSLLGSNMPRAHVMLDAHKALAEWASEVGIVEEADSAKIVRKVDELLEKMTTPT